MTRSPLTRPAPPARVVAVRPAPDSPWAVFSVEGGGGGYRRTPCPTCPWRRDAPLGAFPPEVYRHSAHTAHDAADRMFGCHSSTPRRPSTCAGFILRSPHNLMLRLAVIRGRIDPSKVSSPVPLYTDYVEMAVRNGVPADDPALALCRRAD